MSCPAVDWLYQIYTETRRGPTARMLDSLKHGFPLYSDRAKPWATSRRRHRPHPRARA